MGMGFESKCNFAPPTVLFRASPLPLDVGYLFLVGSNILPNSSGAGPRARTIVPTLQG